MDTHVSSIYGNQNFTRDTIKFFDNLKNESSDIPKDKGDG